ncbi:acyloxyacyl hydrolase-like [Gigantopelta aegis]|uniref:acyloxyacyl hydrolase-like n=1 Tax=Gigantopelta aegis TaxID=1735272 RepID=UPI001B889F95|nr:acyloxyacyl hydrolase-like [Gigantopelta aegis]
MLVVVMMLLLFSRACSIGLGLVYQLGEINNETVTKALERLCGFMPEKIKHPCLVLADFIGPFLVGLVAQKDTPDVVCTAIGLCKTDPGHETCRLWKKPKMDFNVAVEMRRMIMDRLKLTRPVDEDICNLPGIKEICDWVKKIFGSHDAAFDIDSDGYSNFEALRGYSWRGADCNDARGDYHPGARPINSDITDDSNCNGIYGSDPASTRPYEEVFCEGTEPRGVVVLGDSISAHFHLPEEWLDSRKLSKKVFQHLPFIIENEIDWPELSSITGFANNSWPEVIQGPMDSIYKRMFERNRCNHRDYQNIAVNGARSSSMADTIMYSLKRNGEKDYPVFVFYALVGNDVCNGHPDTFAHMTTPQKMHDNAIQTMKYLDKLLPNGSYVMMSGLADGRVLYNSLHDRIHPIGRLNNDVTYPTVYDYLNCLEVSPCTGWMNKNETVRNLTTARALELSNVLKDIAANNASMFPNIHLYYSDFFYHTVFEYWEKKGGQPWQLIEPVDGFHSNQLGQSITAQIIWDNLEQLFPEILGKVNPNNDKIRSTFGDQGGYRP